MERVALYYAQRATAGLIVSEGMPISNEGQGYLFNPGIFICEQIEGWRLTTQSVHAVGGQIFAQAAANAIEACFDGVEIHGDLTLTPFKKTT